MLFQFYHTVKKPIEQEQNQNQQALEQPYNKPLNNHINLAYVSKHDPSRSHTIPITLNWTSTLYELIQIPQGQWQMVLSSTHLGQEPQQVVYWKIIKTNYRGFTLGKSSHPSSFQYFGPQVLVVVHIYLGNVFALTQTDLKQELYNSSQPTHSTDSGQMIQQVPCCCYHSSLKYQQDCLHNSISTLSDQPSLLFQIPSPKIYEKIAENQVGNGYPILLLLLLLLRRLKDKSSINS